MEDALTTPRYDVSNVSRLVGLTKQKARRWLLGYHFGSRDIHGERSFSPSLLRSGIEEASFLDLMELVYAGAFLEAGMSIHKVRKAFISARKHTGQPYPFAQHQVYVSPTEIWLKIKGDDGEMIGLLSNGQKGITRILLQICENIDFGSDQIARAWYPLGRNKHVIVDPFHLGGIARIDGTRLSTRDIVNLWRAEKFNPEAVAHAYGIDQDLVRAAVDYEQRSAA